MSDHDLVIVGAGIAGLTAAMVAARCGLDVAVVDPGISGGQVITVDKIENFPGFPDGVAGYDIGPVLQGQAADAGATFVIDSVESLGLKGADRIVRCAENELSARAVIIASGSSLRNLGIPGEERLLGKGVSHCASCDGPFFVGEEVCVVGGGDSAFDEAVVLTDFASKVYLFHRGDEVTAQKAGIDKASTKANFNLVLNAEVLEIVGEDAVAALRLRDVKTGAERTQAVKGVFVFVGLDPNTAFLRKIVDLDAAGHVVTDVMMRTSVDGIFAAGDVRQASVSQVASVAGDGATAAVAAWRYLTGR